MPPTLPLPQLCAVVPILRCVNTRAATQHASFLLPKQSVSSLSLLRALATPWQCPLRASQRRFTTLRCLAPSPTNAAAAKHRQIRKRQLHTSKSVARTTSAKSKTNASTGHTQRSMQLELPSWSSPLKNKTPTLGSAVFNPLYSSKLPLRMGEKSEAGVDRDVANTDANGDDMGIPDVMKNLASKRINAGNVDKLVNLEALEQTRAMMTMPDINTVDLYNLDTITDDMVSSVEARKMMYRFICNDARCTIKRTIIMHQEEMNGRIMGASLYVRIVHPYEVASRTEDKHQIGSEKTKMQTVAGPAEATTAARKTAQHVKYTRDVKSIRDDIEHVLRRYVSRLIEPHPNELAVDLTHYRTFLALLNVSRRNVEQFLKDANDFIEQRPVNPVGIPAGPPPPDDVKPVSVDVLAAEIARLIRRDVLLPWCAKTLKSDCKNGQEGSEGDSGDAVASADVPRVCIGVATSPVMAKVACDAEVAVVLTRLAALGGSINNINDNGVGDLTAHKAGKEVPLVSIRSLYRHTSSISATRELMSTLPVSQIPLFTPAFAELLRKVFGIRTCDDLRVNQYLLFFCFSPNTSLVCLGAACGRLKFPIEDEVALVALNNLFVSTGAVRFMASNALSIVNAQRTAFALSTDNLTRDSFISKRRFCSNYGFTYGRLNTDAEVLQLALNTVSEAYTKLHRDGVTFGRIRCLLTEDQVARHAFFITVPHHLTRKELLRVVEPQLAPLLQHRKRDGPDAVGSHAVVLFAIQQVKPLLMIPPAMHEEAEELREAVLYMKRRINTCKWVAKERAQTLQALCEQNASELSSKNDDVSVKRKTATPTESKVENVVLV